MGSILDIQVKGGTQPKILKLVPKNNDQETKLTTLSLIYNAENNFIL